MIENPDGSVLHIHGLEETAMINVPELLEGSVDGSEANALLFDSRFAGAHGLSARDVIASSLPDAAFNEMIFTVKKGSDSS